MTYENLAFFSVGTIGICLISILCVVVFFQNKKIKDLTRPSYGFLGKPLALVFGLVFSLTFFGLLGKNINETTTDISVSDEITEELTLKVFTEKISEENNLYKVSASIFKDELEYKSLNYDIYWEINTTGNVLLKTEFKIGNDKKSGFDVNLEKGKNIIKASVLTNTRVLEAELEIYL